jgi:tape measure domain-containing protein
MPIVSAEEVVVDLLARTDKLERTLQRAGRNVDGQLSNMEARGRQFASRFTGALAGVSAVALARQFLTIADAAKGLDAQLRLATGTFGNLAQAQDDVRRLATSTRSSLDATTKLYGGFIRASQETGRSQEDAARATETFSKALKIGGADTNAAASATLQFNQALQSGVLRGDEFNSIMEASPRIARLLADALGVPIGQLRRMAEEGKITSDVLFRALTDRKFTAGIDAEFKQLPTTFADAMQEIENSAIRVIGEFDAGGKFSQSLVAFLAQGETTFAGVEGAARSAGIEIRATFAGLADVFAPIVAAADGAFGTIESRANYARDTIANLLGYVDTIRNADIGFDRFYTRAGRAILGKDTTEANLPQYVDNRGTFLRGSDEVTRTGRAEAILQRFDARFPLDRSTGGVRAVAGAAPRATSPAAAGKGGTRAKSKPVKSPLDGAAFDRQLAGLEDRILANRAQNADRADEAARLEIQRLEAGQARFTSETNSDKRYTEQQKRQLIAANDLLVATERAAVLKRQMVDTVQSLVGEGDPLAGIVGAYERERRDEIDTRRAAEDQMQAIRESNVRELAGMYLDLFEGGTDRVWQRFKQQGLETLAVILAQMTANVIGGKGSIFAGIGGILGGGGGPLGGGVGGLFGGLLGRAIPGLANGGHAAAGSLHWVGERGPELLRMGAQSGTVIPNHALSGQVQRTGGDTTILQTIKVDARGAVMNDQFATLILARADQGARQLVGANNQAILKSLPGAQERFGKLGTL